MFSAIAFMVIGAVAATLFAGRGPARDDPARVPTAGRVDIGFSQDMISHHQQAVTMSQAVRGRAGPAVAQLALGIELNQLKEIGHMQGWLALWNAPQVPSGPPMTWMTNGHSRHGAGAGAGAAMPGLASQQEINRLGEAKGRDLDVRFLQLMIRHHEGGLVMTTAAARSATIPQVRNLAVLMTTEQHKEIATMAGLLAALGHRPLPSPTGRR
ncbi:DUF305 domain-containing protein [Actinomadura craniellae]|uniref:DUF305 domain-containing protein n=1 Tax=Actinomadura craniellae TaxID=2231787 RepID=A0A365GX54_9ACTN|nr:DUF305 domain-containing protein [Actinomadura craniellae]RAY11411.1 DUF305 domain-containing protein [Actinomadura craniellae]